ncbi:unknown [Mycoplasma sp. CAG:877]|nr:unknown [Mycoplasma sp. CAG:877]
MDKNNFNIKKYIEKIKKSIKKVTYLLRGNKFKISFLGIFTICVLILFISNSFAVEVPVETTSFTSSNINYDSGESGAWKITRTASWISKNKAKVVYDLKTNPSETSLPVDYVLVVDGSLNEHDASFSAPLKTLLNNMHHYNNINNRVAVIGFNDKAEILTDFTNDENGSNTVLDNFLSTSATANKEISYYAAMEALLDFMNNYTSDGAEYVKVIFVTDGKPMVDSPKEIGTYLDLKDKYPELSFLAIQYEMGDAVVPAVANISDEQIVTNKNNVWDILNNVYLGCGNDSFYDNFVLNDYFKAPFTVDKVETTRGVATIDSEYSVEWNLNDSSQFVAGASARMTVYFNVSNEYTVGDIIPISDTTIVNYSYAGREEEVTDVNSPTLATGFKVNYDSNAPSGCVVSNMPSSDVVGIYNIVRPTTVVPKCSGYIFKGWKLTTSNVIINNDGSFTMPYKEVTYKATWAKASLNKSAEGTIAEKATLYGVLRDEVSNGGVAKEYTGKHQDSVDGSGSSKIYYYTASNDTDGTTVLSKNNVVFAGMCWQMIRTTDTGDVRMIYNGEVDSNDGCGTDRKNHPNYSGIEEITLNAKHKYSTDYSYNKTLKNFKVAGDLVTVDTSNPSSLIGTYTCLNSHKAVSCSTLYQVLYVEDSKIYAVAIKSSDIYNSIGTSIFNNLYGYNSEMGYMYNGNYPGNTYEISNIEIKKEQIDFSTGTYCETVTYDTSTKTYSCSGNPRYFWEVGGDDFRKSLVHNYVVSDDNPSVVRYMIGINIDENDMTNSYYYYIELTDGQTMDDFYVYGDGYTINDDGTYKITNPTLITKRDFYYSYSDYKGKYFGEDLQIREGNYNSTSYDGYKNGGLINTNRVSSLFYNLSSGGSSLTVSNYQSYLAFSPISKIPKFSSSVTYSNGKYKLSGTVTNIGLYDTSNISKVNNTHYTCFTAGDECSSVYYVYYANGNYIYSIKLNNGENISGALVNMFNSSTTNSKDSIIKQLVESWYAHSLSSYTSYLADTVYCNDRSIKSLGGFDPNGGNLYSLLTFNGTSNTSLLCSNEADRFSVSNSVAPLKYPIGLLSGAEANLLGNNKVRASGSKYWLMSPSSLTGTSIGQFVVEATGTLNSTVSINSSNYIRPVITLKGSLILVSGDGSVTSPYVVSTN